MKTGLRRMRASTATCAVAAVVACTPSSAPPLRVVAGVAQGTTYSLQWTTGAAEPEIAAAAEQELARIDALLSNYREDSTLELFNATHSTDPIELPRELVALLELAKRVHDASDGCFDPTVRPLVHAWGFDGDSPAVPAPAVLDAAREAVGLDKLELIDFRVRILDASHGTDAVTRVLIETSDGETVIVGPVDDQAALHGLLRKVRDLGMPLVSVSPVEPDIQPIVEELDHEHA